FLFQAEDGIRDFHVTGVQTCALPILLVEIVTTVLILLGLRWLPRRIPGIDPLQPLTLPRRLSDLTIALGAGTGVGLMAYAVMRRSEERRVGRERRLRRSTGTARAQEV